MSKTGLGYEHQGGLAQRLQEKEALRQERIASAGGGLKARIDARQGIIPQPQATDGPRISLSTRIMARRDSYVA